MTADVLEQGVSVKRRYRKKMKGVYKIFLSLKACLKSANKKNKVIETLKTCFYLTDRFLLFVLTKCEFHQKNLLKLRLFPPV